MFNPFRRTNYNPKSMENLKWNQNKTSTDISGKAKDEAKAISTLLEVQRGLAELEKAQLEALKAKQDIVHAEAQQLIDAMPAEEGGDEDGLMKMLIPLFLSRMQPNGGALPYSTTLTEAQTGGEAIAHRADEPPVSTSQIAGLKAALKLPDATWTKENIRMVLGNNGLGELSDKDLKKLAQKILKAVD